jgi:hypothetical protein
VRKCKEIKVKRNKENRRNVVRIEDMREIVFFER